MSVEASSVQSGNFYSGISGLPCLLLHGGAGRADSSSARWNRKQEAIEEGAKRAFQILRDGGSAAEAVVLGVRFLEESPLFNAGRGGALQKDGVARLSAAYMDGPRQSFSGVALAENLIHPVDLARALQHRPERVLCHPGVEALMSELAIPRESPITEESIATWKKTLAESSLSGGTGTVGAVALDIRGRLAAATSTGGFGADAAGRMSDVATVAGNYASVHAAVSCTGKGEQIVDAGLAVRLETRVRDGATLAEAAKKTQEEAIAQNHYFGWIALDSRGSWVVAHTTPTICWARRSLDL